MAKILYRPTVKLSVHIELTEDEAGALDALFGYDCEHFLKVFYSQMGRHYLEPFEAGIRSLHESRGFLSGALRRAGEARKIFAAAQPPTSEVSALPLRGEMEPKE